MFKPTVITVIEMLKYGGKYHAKLEAHQIDDDHIRAYLIQQRLIDRAKTQASLIPLLNGTRFDRQWVN